MTISDHKNYRNRDSFFFAISTHTHTLDIIRVLKYVYVLRKLCKSLFNTVCIHIEYSMYNKVTK